MLVSRVCVGLVFLLCLGWGGVNGGVMMCFFCQLLWACCLRVDVGAGVWLGSIHVLGVLFGRVVGLGGGLVRWVGDTHLLS